ncbi:MAG: BrnT family toxin [Candidatus Eisenbacteria sp.]|nr:BrnT family toxin [Candidatus Eisenbacteria bacterium]
MRVIWDPVKARANLQKHGVHFSDAEGVLLDPLAITLEDPSAAGEHRYISIGVDFLGQILVVLYTHRESNLRMISARRAMRKERIQYEEGV